MNNSLPPHRQHVKKLRRLTGVRLVVDENYLSTYMSSSVLRDITEVKRLIRYTLCVDVVCSFFVGLVVAQRHRPAF